MKWKFLNKMEIIIRKAIKDDMPAVYGLVMELAIYEKAPEAVWSKVENYFEDFEEGWFEAIVAEVGGKVAGMVLYYKTYSTWKGKMLYLEDFVIAENHRRKGIGKHLFDALIKQAKAWKVNLIKWQVLDWNEPAIEFYKQYDTKFDGEWINCLLLKDALDYWEFK